MGNELESAGFLGIGLVYFGAVFCGMVMFQAVIAWVVYQCYEAIP